MLKSARLLLKLSLPVGMTVLALLVGPAVPKAAAACHYYGYIDDIYTDATKTEWCGTYNSCTRTYYGCRTGYRTTEVTICNCGL